MGGEIRPRLDEYGAEDMVLPEARLVQRTGGEVAKEKGAKLGQFYNTVTGVISDELNIVVVDILAGRTRWEEDAIGSSGPECYSLDTKRNLSADGRDCLECEYRLDTPWSVSAAERRTKCCLNYTVLGIDLDHDQEPVIIRGHGVSVKPMRELITQLRMNQALRGDYFRAVVNVKGEERKTDFGVVYAPSCRLVKLITDDAKVKELKLQSQQLLGAPLALPEGRPEDELVEVQAEVAVDKRGEFEKEGRDVVKEAIATTEPKSKPVGAQHVELPDADLWDNI